MASDLFDAEYDSDFFTSGPTHKGKDGGTDGAYEGMLLGMKGGWKVACAVRQSIPALEKKIEEENRKAKRDMFKGLLLMTPLDLNVKETKRLSKLAGTGLKKGAVWGRSKHERLLQKNPWVAAVHFARSVIPGFVPVDKEEEKDIPEQLDLPLIGREAELMAINDFLIGSNRVLVILAAGGCGKSRLLRETNKLPTKKGARRIPWLRRIGQGTVDEALKGGLPIGKPLLLCMDDAGRDVKEVQELARISKNGLPSIDAKLILSARVADREVINKALSELGVLFTEIEIENLSTEDLVRIAKEEWREIPDDTANKIAKFSGSNVFILRAFVQLLKKGLNPAKIVNDERLRSTIANRLLTEAISNLEGTLSKEASEKALLKFSLNTPFRVQESDQEVVNILLEAKLLRKVGAKVRFRADVEGDLLLAHIIRRPSAIVYARQLLSSEPHALLTRVRNLAAAGSGKATDLVKEACKSWLGNAHAEDETKKLHIVEVLPYCCEAAPEEVSNICIQYVRSGSNLSTDQLGPIVISLSRNSHPVQALGLLRSLREAGLTEGMYTNYKMSELGNEIVNLAYHEPDEIKKVCSQIDSWLNEVGIGQSAQICEAVFESILGTTLHWRTSETMSLTFHEQAINPTNKILDLRSCAIQLIEKMCVHPDNDIRLAAVSLILNREVRTRGNVDTSHLNKLVEAEAKIIFPFLEKLLENEKVLAVQSKATIGLIHCWAAEHIGYDLAEQILKKYRWSVLLKAYQFVHNRWDWVSDFNTLVTRAPSQDRWSWWVDETHTKSSEQRNLETSVLAVELYTKFLDKNSTLFALKEIGVGDNIFELMRAWCKLKPTIFYEIIEDGSTEDRLKNVIERTLRRQRFEENNKLAVQETKDALDHSFPPEKVEEIVYDALPLPMHETEELIETLVTQQAIAYRRIGIRRLPYQNSLQPGKTAELVETALRDGDWSEGLDDICRVFNEKTFIKELDDKPSLAVVLETRLIEVISEKNWKKTGRDSHFIKQLLNILIAQKGALRLKLVEASIKSKDYDALLLAANMVAPIFNSENNLSDLVTACKKWMEDGYLNGTSERGVLFKKADQGDHQIILKKARELIKDGDEKRSLIGISLLAELRTDSDACVCLAEAAALKTKVGKIAKSRLDLFLYTKGVMKYTPGETPQALVVIKDMLESALDKTLIPEAKAIIQNLINGAKQNIQNYKFEDEEVFDLFSDD